MSVLSREQFLAQLQRLAGEDTTEDTIHMVEDFTDTYNQLESNSSADGVNWQQRYEENDKSWRQKYRDRFFNPPTKPEQGFGQEEEEEPPKEITIEDLFS